MEAGRVSPELGNLFDKLYGDVEPYQIVELGRDVQDLVTHPGWVAVTRVVEALRERGVGQLMQGQKPLEQAEYAQRLGFLNGVGVALDAAATVIARGEAARTFLERSAGQAAGVN